MLKKFLPFILCSIVLFGGIAVLTILYMSADRRSITLEYNCYETLVNNGIYEGEIQSDYVCIKNKEGVEISKIRINSLSMEPDEILLGKNYYYLVQYDEDSSTVLQLDFHSKIKRKETIKGLVRVRCMKEVLLFLLKREDQDFSKYQYGLCGNYYIEEKHFGEEPIQLDSKKIDKLPDGLNLYCHKNGFFYTVPDLGVETDDIFFYDKVSAVKEITGRKGEILNQLIRETGADKNNVLYVRCYQKGTKLYGICNVLNFKYDDICMRTKDIIKTKGFVYDSAENNCRIMYSDNQGKCGLLINEREVYYEEEGTVYVYYLQDGKRNKIYTADKEDDLQIQLSGNTIHIFMNNSWENTGEARIKKTTALTAEPSYKQIEETYINKVKEVAEGDVAKSYIADFEMNGEKSGFVLTEKKISEMESKFSLWFVSNDGVKMLKKDVLAVNDSTLELIKNHDSVHVLFREVQFTLNDKFIASIYGVYNGKPKLLFSKNKIRIDIDDEKIYGTEKQYCYYDFSTKSDSLAAGVAYEFYWDEQNDKYMEYGAEKISKSEFLKYSGGKEIWNKLKKEEVMEKNLKIKYTILKRTNNTIDINMETISKEGCYKSYTTLMVEDKKILTEKIVYHDGNKKCCKYPEIAGNG